MRTSAGIPAQREKRSFVMWWSRGTLGEKLSHKDHDVEVAEDLHEIEHDHGVLQVERLPMGHHFGAPLIHKAQIQGNNSRDRPWRGHQREVLCPWITRLVEQVVIVIDNVPYH